MALRVAGRSGCPGRTPSHTRRAPGAAEALGAGRRPGCAQAASPRAPQPASPRRQVRGGRASLRPVRLSPDLRSRASHRPGRVRQTATGPGRALVARPGPVRRCGRPLHRLLPHCRAAERARLGQGDPTSGGRAGAGRGTLGSAQPGGVPWIPSGAGPVRKDPQDRCVPPTAKRITGWGVSWPGGGDRCGWLHGSGRDARAVRRVLGLTPLRGPLRGRFPLARDRGPCSAWLPPGRGARGSVPTRAATWPPGSIRAAARFR